MRRQSSNDAVAPEPSTQNKIWYLKQSRLFDRASDETIANCEHLFVQQVYKKGTTLFQQGDEARFVYLIKRGTVRIAKRTLEDKDVTVAILGAGCVFGEEVVFSAIERTTVAICMTDALLCMSRAEHVYGLMTRFPTLALNVAKYLLEQRDDALAVAEDVAFLTVPERLMRLFERLSQEHGKQVVDGTLLDIRLTHADLASLIGTTRETVSAKLPQLVRDGHIRFEDRAIVVLRS
jgi:CRP-like cAMP-binding protein